MNISQKRVSIELLDTLWCQVYVARDDLPSDLNFNCFMVKEIGDDGVTMVGYMTKFRGFILLLL